MIDEDSIEEFNQIYEKLDNIESQLRMLNALCDNFRDRIIELEKRCNI